MRIITRTIGLLLIACLVLVSGGILYSCNRTIESLNYAEHEKHTAEICNLPLDILYKYILIGRANRQGAFVNNLWLEIHYYGHDRNQRLASTFDKARDAFLEAESVGFNLRLDDPRHPDDDIVVTIIKLKDDCGDANRRAIFDERLNDFLKYLGLTTLLVFTAWLLIKIIERVPNWRK